MGGKPRRRLRVEHPATIDTFRRAMGHPDVKAFRAHLAVCECPSPTAVMFDKPPGLESGEAIAMRGPLPGGRDGH